MISSKEAWKKFETTGSVNDYLDYKKLQKLEIEKST